MMAVYDRCTASQYDSRDIDYDRTPLAANSFLLLQMPWMRSCLDVFCSCYWLTENLDKTEMAPTEDIHDEEVALVSQEGLKFITHGSIISCKSGKLESAIRFAKMNSRYRSGETVELQIPIPAEMLRHMIQHFYHGSICFTGPPMSDKGLCRYLLELMIVAEEFLCLDLVKEIEMRLLSSDPQSCFCWNCCRAVRAHPRQVGNRKAQCMYCIDTNSRLVAENTVLDVLGLLEFMEAPEYTLQLLPMNIKTLRCVQSTRLWADHDDVKWLSNIALATLRDTVNLVVLRKFAQVVETASFLESTNVSADGSESQKNLLLQMSLDDLRRNSLLSPLQKKTIPLSGEVPQNRFPNT